MAVWITWEKQIRNRSMAENLGIDLYQFDYRGSRIARYFYGIKRTLTLVNRERPKVVIAQNPSVVLNLFLLGLKYFYSFKHVIDSHYAGVVSVKHSVIFQKLLDYVNRNADIVIVTNENHYNYILDIGGTGFLCEDPLPELENIYEGYINTKYVFLICSFDIDEPYEEVFKISKKLNEEGLQLFVTGNYNKIRINPENYPFVSFLGYIPYEEYCKYLFNASVVVDLTNIDNCLVCGAYEAMAAEKPLVTSDTEALRKYFSAGTIFTKNFAGNILKSIIFAYQEREKLIIDIREWKYTANEQMDLKITQLKIKLNL